MTNTNPNDTEKLMNPEMQCCTENSKAGVQVGNGHSEQLQLEKKMEVRRKTQEALETLKERENGRDILQN